VPASGGGLCELGGGELGVTSTWMTTVTVMPPGLTVSWQPTHTPAALPDTARTREPARPSTPPLTLTLTVALWPACRRPEDGATVSWPIRPDDSEIDHDTGPPEAVSVRVLPDSALTTIVLGVTRSVPGGGGGAAVVLLGDGAGELGEGLCRGDGLWLGDGAEAEGDGPPRAGDVPPADGEGDTRAPALAVGVAEPPEPPGPELPGLAELPGWVPDDGRPAPAPVAPGGDDPWLSALRWPWFPPNAPVSARTVSTAAIATTAAAAAP
jgi:hypothetical protein